MIREEQIVAMAIAAIAEQSDCPCENLKVLSFREVSKSSLEQYLTENGIVFNKYSLE